ncbi:MAG: polyprenyl diphosphate synthase [Pseudomonadaceae bacterium]|nr:polyprenyl diphosphate synthase [Pseudomonadaceae bacterium]
MEAALAGTTNQTANQNQITRQATEGSPEFLMQTDFVLQSSLQHIAIIMDGNRRWAKQRGLSANAGHRAGARTLQTIIEAISETAVSTLSVFGFSQLNWQRPADEVQALFRLIGRKLVEVADTCRERELRVEFIGRRDRLPHALVRQMTALEATTGRFNRCLRIAIDYSARSAIATAASATPALDLGVDSFAAQMSASQHSSAVSANSVDLLIRTGGEQRLSDFLLWESAFAELRFEDCYWPDYSPAHLQRAITDFESRQRRFGR